MLPSYDVLSHFSLPSPLLAFPFPTHNPSHDAWQSKRHAYATPFYGHGTPPPSCFAEPSNRGRYRLRTSDCVNPHLVVTQRGTSYKITNISSTIVNIPLIKSVAIAANKYFMVPPNCLVLDHHIQKQCHRVL
jgi:hypothetical protein